MTALLERAPTVAGFAHLFSFPFWLFVNLESPLRTGLSVFPNRVGLRFYPPFRSAPANFAGAPHILAKAIPFDDRLPGQEVTVIQMAAIPMLSGEGGPSYTFHWSPNWNGSERKLFPMNSLRIDVIGTSADEIKLDAILRRLLQRLRVRTRQWWITRGNSGLKNHGRNYFAIDKHGGTLTPYANAAQRVRIPFGFESAINDPLWITCVEEAVGGLETPTAELSVLDAFYFVAEDDRRNAVMHGCWALEQAVESEFARLWYTKNKPGKFRRGFLRSRDASVHIDRCAERHFQRSFAREFPAKFQNIRHLWRARNVAAHGGTGGAYERVLNMTTEELEDLIRSVNVAVRWLQSL